MQYILFFLALVACFYGGVLVGIKDCKRRFAIPVGAQRVYDLGDGIFTYKEVVIDDGHD